VSCPKVKLPCPVVWELPSKVLSWGGNGKGGGLGGVGKSATRCAQRGCSAGGKVQQRYRLPFACRAQPMLGTPPAPAGQSVLRGGTATSEPFSVGQGSWGWAGGGGARQAYTPTAR